MCSDNHGQENDTDHGFCFLLLVGVATYRRYLQRLHQTFMSDLPAVEDNLFRMQAQLQKLTDLYAAPVNWFVCVWWGSEVPACED